MSNFNEWIQVREAFEQGVLEDFRDETMRAQDMHGMAHRIDRLQVFMPHRMPANAYEMWSNLTDKGRRTRPGAKKEYDEAPKVTFNRFVQRKRDEFAKLRKEFMAKFGFDSNDIDVPNSNSNHIVNKHGELIAPINRM